MWVWLRPSRATIAAARAQMDEDRRDFGSAGFFEGEGWWGNLGELAVERWLCRSGIEAERIGRINGRPDVVCAGQAIGVKTRKVPERFVDDVDCIVPEQHLDKPWDAWVFCAYFAAWGRVAILGALSPAAVRDRGRYTLTYGKTTNGCRIVKPQQLVEPGAFVAGLRTEYVRTRP